MSAFDDTLPADILPEGLEDYLQPGAARATRAMRAALDTLDGHGYDRVRPPLVEFEQSMATRMANVSANRMFRFVDPASLQMLALRSDMTVQVGRMAATSLNAAPRPLRLCYAGEVATIAPEGLDPARQSLQIGAELVGGDSAEAAAEIATLAIAALRAAGAENIGIDFTLPDLVDTLSENALPLPAEKREAVRRELDMKDAGALKAVGGEAYLPLLYAAGPFEQALAHIAAIDAGGALASRIAGLRKVAEHIGDSARITLDPTERHGFEYQSWFGFTLYADGVRGAMGRGGTYAIGGTDEVATGFSLYLDPLVRVLPDQPPHRTAYLPPDHDKEVAADLRAKGWRTVNALIESENPVALGCTHRLEGAEPVAL